MRRDNVLVDAVVTDAPYHLASIVSRLGSPDAAPIQSGATGVYARSSAGFMGQQWDGGDVAFRAETWAAIAAVMKPGAYLVAFGGTRTFHRMVSAIEAAGFEVRDRIWNVIAADEHVTRFLESLSADQMDAFAQAIEDSQFGGELAWIFGTGFPKSHNLDGEHDGKGTALKPGYEPILLARKPSPLPVPESVARFGTGAINIDACRIHASDAVDPAGREGEGSADSRSHQTSDTGFTLKGGRRYKRRRMAPGADVNATGAYKGEGEYEGELKPGRWPANVVHDGSPQVLAAFAEHGDKGAAAPVHTRNAPMFGLIYQHYEAPIVRPGTGFHGDAGTAARFFYSSKASDAGRVFRCRQCGLHQVGKPKCGHKDARGNPDFQTHPTVKPEGLMRWLVRLVCPPGGLVLDPFAGTGTTGAAAIAEGCDALLIEREDAYVADICVRLGLPIDELTTAQVRAAPSQLDGHGPLFGSEAA